MHTHPLVRPLDDKAKQALSAFAQRGERSRPLTFIGRDDLLADTAKRLDNLAVDEEGEPNPLVVVGPPGAGKSALLRELDRRNDRGLIRRVHLDGMALGNLVDVAEAFVQAMDLKLEALAETTQNRAYGKVGVVGFGGGLSETTIHQSLLGKLDQSMSVWSALRTTFHWDSGTVFLVLVDEAQTVQPGPNGDPNPILFNLLQGRTGGMKCLPVFAGLSSTVDRLLTAGASPRLSGKVKTLGAFSKSECDQATRAFFNHPAFALREAVKPEHRARMRRDIRIASEQYPRHVHCYLSALAERLGEGDQVDWGAVLDEGHQRRIAYSAQLVSEESHPDAAKTLRRLARSESDTLFRADIERAALKCGTKQSAEEIRAWAIHRGVLSPVPGKSGQYQFPLPSMRTYLRHDNEDDCLRVMRRDCSVRIERESSPSPT